MTKFLTLAFAGSVLGGCLSVAAQQRAPAPPPPPPAPDENVMLWRTDAPHPGDDNTFVFVSAEGGRGGVLVKGAPYSAEAVTETVQALSDGNRIVRRNSAMLYRDTDGRTRREQSLGAIGGWTTSGDAPRIVSIFDPVAGISYSLNQRDKTATKFSVNSAPQGLPRMSGGEGGNFQFRVMTRGNGETAPPAPLPPPPGAIIERQEIVVMNDGNSPAGVARVAGDDNRPKPEVRSEDLGTQTIEGVSAQGKRSTMIFPVGFFGNERPLEVVSETWFSPELKTTVMTKRSDPRNGVTTYRLTNINRANPDASLFQVPGDYKVTEPQMRQMRTRKPE